MARRVKAPPMPEVKTHITALRGGLNQLSPTLALEPGACRESSNYECAATGGYRRIGGYERYDGRARPSDATYTIVQVVSFTNTPTVGQTLTGATSLATGQIIVVGANYVALTLITGTFTTSEVVKVGATTIGTATPRTITISALVNAQYLNLAADVYRALIQEVPGSGPIRGVVSAVLGGANELYAFRDNAGATACEMYRATTSGWSKVTFYWEVKFTNGGVSTPSDGATITQGANSATIKRVVLQAGSWAAGTAEGWLVITVPAPGAFAAGAATIGAVNVSLTSAGTAVSFLPGGTFEFDVANFAGQLATTRIYGADGVNRCFEFDGTTLVPIATGTTVDTPKHIKVHHEHLFISIGASILHSGLGSPYLWTAAGGAGEHAVGDTVTGFLIQPGNQDNAAMAVFSRNGSGMLYGTSVSTFKLVNFASATGGIDYMCQNLDKSYVLDDRGLVSLEAAQTYGNFAQATLTEHIQTFISDKRSLAACSTVSKDKGQYRAFFSDGSGLYVTIAGGKFLGAMPVQFPDAIKCVWNSELSSGDEATFMGSADNGYVFQLDKGSSFDGANIDASLTLNWNALKSPRVRKRYRGASLELQGSFYAAVTFAYALGYDSTDISQPAAKEYTSNFEGLAYFDSAVWDAFMWDGGTAVPTEVDMDGRAENVEVTLSSSTDYIYPYTMTSLTIHYSAGKAVR